MRVLPAAAGSEDVIGASVRPEEVRMKESVVMQKIEIARQPAREYSGLGRDDYNFTHFRTKHLIADMHATLQQQGIQPGALAPDFELPRVDGASWRLSEQRGKPILLHFGSIT
jgi:hypothetical protein